MFDRVLRLESEAVLDSGSGLKRHMALRLKRNSQTPALLRCERKE